jgi:hypothetical protein
MGAPVGTNDLGKLAIDIITFEGRANSKLSTNKGDIYSCAKSSTTDEFRGMLDCDED